MSTRNPLHISSYLCIFSLNFSGVKCWQSTMLVYNLNWISRGEGAVSFQLPSAAKKEKWRGQQRRGRKWCAGHLVEPDIWCGDVRFVRVVVSSRCVIGWKEEARQGNAYQVVEANTTVPYATVNVTTLPAADQEICRRVEANIASIVNDTTGFSANESITNDEKLDTVKMSSAIKSSASPGITPLLPVLRHCKYEHFVAGISGGVVSTLMLHPLDLIKTRFAGKRLQTCHCWRHNGRGCKWRAWIRSVRYTIYTRGARATFYIYTRIRYRKKFSPCSVSSSLQIVDSVAVCFVSSRS